MWQKIKSVLAVIGAVALGALSFVIGFLCRADRGRVSDNNERLESSRDRLESDRDRIRECKEILERARKRAEEGTD